MMNPTVYRQTDVFFVEVERKLRSMSNRDLRRKAKSILKRNGINEPVTDHSRFGLECIVAAELYNA